MYKLRFIWLLLSFIILAQPGWTGGSARLSPDYGPPVKNHGQMYERSSSTARQSKRVEILQTQAIEKYTKLGSQFESQKKWADAEKSFRYVLHVIAIRDGVGSFKSISILEHLITISKAQNKLEQAADFQETATRLKKAQLASR